MEAEKANFLTNPKNDLINQEESDPINSDDQSFSERIAAKMQHFLTPEAKKAFFISFIAIMLSFFSGIWILLSYITDVFNETGSALSEKNSSILVSIAPLITNMMFLSLVERFNRKVC